jgi:hypothetical protein
MVWQKSAETETDLRWEDTMMTRFSLKIKLGLGFGTLLAILTLSGGIG